MRRLVLSVVLMSAGAAMLAAQRPQVEVFDSGGLPARPGTDTERELARRIAGHRRGDLAGAARIQRDLARYYRSKGDYARARAAEERAAAYGGMPLMLAPGGTRGEEKPPKYRNVPAPADASEDAGAVSVPAYTPAADAKAEAGAARVESIEPPPPAPAAETVVEPADESPISGPFHVLQGRTLHKWYFRPDGTFEHAWMVVGGAEAVGMEAGTYRVSGPFVTLFVERIAGTPRGRGQRRLRFERRGSGGLMLDGLALKSGLP